MAGSGISQGGAGGRVWEEEGAGPHPNGQHAAQVLEEEEHELALATRLADAERAR